MPRIRRVRRRRRLAAALLAIVVVPVAGGPAPAASPRRRSPAAPAAGPHPPPAAPRHRRRPQPVATTAAPTRGPAPRRAERRIVQADRGGLVPGAVNRTSLDLTAEYDVALALNFGSRAVHGRLDDDRHEHVGRTRSTGSSSTRSPPGSAGCSSAPSPSTARPSTRPSTTRRSCVPLGGILAAGAVGPGPGRLHAPRSAARSPARTGCSPGPTASSTPTAGSRGSAGDSLSTGRTTAIRSSRPSARASGSRSRPTAPLVFATTGERVAASGLTQTFEATNVRDFVFTAAPDYRTISATVGDTTIRVYYRPGVPASTMLAAGQERASRRWRRSSGRTRTRPTTSPSRPAATAMESPGLIWIPTRRRRRRTCRYLVDHETAHQWFYGIVGNDQATSRSPTRPSPTSSPATSSAPARELRCSTARLDLSIYRYSSALLLRGRLHPGRQLPRRPAHADGLDARSGAGSARTSPRTASRSPPTKTLLDTLDDHTPLDLVPRFEPRFPRLY